MSLFNPVEKTLGDHSKDNGLTAIGPVKYDANAAIKRAQKDGEAVRAKFNKERESNVSYITSGGYTSAESITSIFADIDKRERAELDKAFDPQLFEPGTSWEDKVKLPDKIATPMPEDSPYLKQVGTDNPYSAAITQQNAIAKGGAQDRLMSYDAWNKTKARKTLLTANNNANTLGNSIVTGASRTLLG
jgi:hypothetical protein